ncbi:hypothetical protein A0257_10100 [Hymenobacter psoromatis]|nr:hypothetical protein A0257_10100 [Hymenobacter psoromatis]
MRWTILSYAPQHTGPLRQLYLEARQTAFTWQDPNRFGLPDFDRVIEGEKLLVATHQEMPIGFIAWWPPDNFVHSLFIAPSWQRQGVGRALLQAGLARMARPAALKCLQANQPALRFYLAQGWTITGADEDPDGVYYLLSFTEESLPGSKR